MKACANGKLVVKQGPRISGRFCERIGTPRKLLDAGSLRWKGAGGSWVLVGCPREQWVKGKCRGGMKAHRILAAVGGESTRRGNLGGFASAGLLVPIAVYGVLGFFAWRFVAGAARRLRSRA